MSKPAKSVILYHRSCRKISGSSRTLIFEFLLFVLPLSLTVLLYYPEITGIVCRNAHDLLAPFFPHDALAIIQAPYITGNVSLIDLPSVHPSSLFSAANAGVSLILLVLLPRIKRAKHVFLFLVVVSFINLVSSLYFTFFPYRFPYEAVDYSGLYIKQQIGIWFFVPLIMGLAVLPLPSTRTAKIVTLLSAFFYSLLFGTVRYAVFLFILTKASLLYMAILFFILGPLVDFVYIVGIYSLHVTRLAKKMKGDFAFWKWLY